MLPAKRIIEEVTRTSIELLLKEPFYSHLFSSLNKEVVTDESGIATMAVSLYEKTFSLFINAGFWDNFLTDKLHRYGVVKHEILHIIFKHLHVNEPHRNRLLLNIAMDLVVNQYIERNLLPGESIFLETFPELQLEKEKGYGYYYEKLEELQQNAGTVYKDSIAARNLASIKENSHGLERHKPWKNIYSLSNIDREILDAQIDNLVNIANNKTPVKSFSSLPAGVRIQINNILLKPAALVDWKRVLKLFSESSSKTRVKNTLKRPSKRFGTIPGIKIKHHQKLLVALDTSGSISKKEYELFFNELYHIWRRGTVIQVVECDAKIQHTYTYKGVTPNTIHGGGGTDFNAPIKYANEVFHPDGLIYFTDGVAPAPEVIPRIQLLWVISKQGITTDSTAFKKLPGRKAKLI
ncbi:MAG: VWA-like domain-containing protein [Ferruginibacter sp.]